MKTKLLLAVTSMLALFTLNSCLQVESTISLKKDGSGTITEDLIFGEQMVQMIQMGMAQTGGAGAKAKDPFSEMLDKKKAAKRAKEMGEGVELVSVTKIDADGKLGVRTVFKFSDINKLNYNSADAMNMGDKGPKSEENEKADKPTFKYANGKLIISQKHPKSKEGEKAKEAAKEDEKEDPMDAQSLAMMQGMMKDMRMTMKIKFEPGIAKTNATYVDGDTITIMEIDFGKVVKDPKKLKALQGGDFEKTKKALEGIDGIKFESKETVEVELK